MNVLCNTPVLFVFKPTYIALSLAAVLSAGVHANDDIEVLEVRGQQHNNANLLGSVDALLKQQGVEFSAAGGMSSLPVMNGMMGDRVKVLVDGADITAACANHMNPPLSYVSANQVQSFAVVAGVSPVSVAGDNIAGVISVNEIAPAFTGEKSLGWHEGYASVQYKSVNQAKSVGLGAKLASDWLSIDYQGAYEDAQSYKDGNGDVVLDTLYRAQNHALTGAIKDGKDQLAVKITHQNIPFQGFANQYMDMTNNKSVGITSVYQRQLETGDVSAQLNWHSVNHEMGFFTPEKTGMMPMKTEADDYSYRLNWRFEQDGAQSWKIGHEYFGYHLNDWWPALENSMMMGPNDYLNINDGRRQRIALFAENERNIGTQWWVSAGARLERVRTDAGEVQAYNNDSGGSMGMGSGMGSGMGMEPDMAMRNTSNYQAAIDFNASSRERSDTLLDLTLLARYQLSPEQLIELGVARKNRAPNLYERYSWGVSTMATTMIGWFGDANGYIGDPDLQPETAHTLSVSYNQTNAAKNWQFSANLWYTAVNDYIDAEVVGSFNSGPNDAAKRNILQFTNVDATLYGTKLSAMLQLADSQQWGQWQVDARLSTTHGNQDNSDVYLYQIVPLQTELALRQQSGNWQNAIVWQWVDSKTQVDTQRLENTTKSYHLLNLETQVNWQQLTVSLALNNALDSYYEQPMGGVSIAQFNQDKSKGFSQLAGAERSFNLGLSYAF